MGTSLFEKTCYRQDTIVQGSGVHGVDKCYRHGSDGMGSVVDRRMFQDGHC